MHPVYPAGATDTHHTTHAVQGIYQKEATDTHHTAHVVQGIYPAGATDTHHTAHAVQGTLCNQQEHQAHIKLYEMAGVEMLQGASAS